MTCRLTGRWQNVDAVSELLLRLYQLQYPLAPEYAKRTRLQRGLLLQRMLDLSIPPVSGAQIIARPWERGRRAGVGWCGHAGIVVPMGMRNDHMLDVFWLRAQGCELGGKRRRRGVILERIG